MAQWMRERSTWSTSHKKSACNKGSPPVNVTPPLLRRKIFSSRRSLSANSCDSISNPLMTVSPLTFVEFCFFFISCGRGLSPSGLWHHSHLNGHPFKKTVVLMPGPSFMANSSMLNIVPFMLQRYTKFATTGTFRYEFLVLHSFFFHFSLFEVI